MESSKTATTIQEQIETLRKRGMSIDDEGKAIENLSDIGYYRLGFYWFPLRKHIHERNKEIIHSKREQILIMS